MPAFRKKPVDVVIDVRSKLEFWLGHLDGAICIPVSTIADGITNVPGITRDSRVMLYCASGSRSAMAADALRRIGFRRVTDAGAMGAARPDYTP